MLAAADAAEGIGSMPADLELALHCERWNALPEAGGLLDQPLGLVSRMTALLNIYRAMSAEQNRGNMSLVEFSKSNPDSYKIMIKIHNLRQEHGSES